MIHNKNLILLPVFFCLFFFTINIHAQENCQLCLYKTFINGEMDKWGNIIETYAINKPIETIDEKLVLLNYYYGYIGYLLGEKEIKIGEIYLDKGEELIKEILDTDPRNAAACAYKSAFCGWRISLDHSKAPILGPVFLYYNSRAYSLDSLNIQAIVDRANFYFYAPGFIGGDALKAAKLYNKAVTLMEENNLAQTNWQYFNTLILEAKANDKADDQKRALDIYIKILGIEPDFKWVKDRLLVDLLSRMKH